MAYLVTSKSPTQVKNVGIGHAPVMFTGVVALSGGTATVSIPGYSRIVSAFVSAQSSNATYVGATATNTFTITGTSSDVVMWMAFAEK
jgi:hypothetical protein